MSPRATKRAGETAYLRVTQVRSAIGTKPKHRATLRALGLRGVGRSTVISDSPTLRGMIDRVSHLVEVAPAAEAERTTKPRRSEAHRAATIAGSGSGGGGERS